MKVLSKTLWAVDVDNVNTMSIERIKNLAQQFKNDVVLVHVLPEKLKTSEYKEKIENSVKRVLEKVRDNIATTDKSSIKIRIVYGSIAERVIQVAKEEDVNAIIINKGKKETLGEHGVQILRKSKKPVSIVSASKHKPKSHIVTPVDGSKESAAALRSALLHAKKTESWLSVIGVFEPFENTSPRLMRLGLDEKKENAYHLKNFKKEFNAFLSNFDFAGVDTTIRILQGKPDAEIIKYSKKASLLYVGKSNKSFLTRAFKGSVSENVIRQVACNIVAVKGQDVFKLRIPSSLANVEKHYKRGKELIKLGYIKEAIEQLRTGLQVNDLHLPSIVELSNVFDEIGNKEQSNYYRELAETIRNKMVNRKIEAEMRRNLRTSGAF